MSRTLKVVIIGDGSVGKTSLRSRYLQDSFQKAYISTIGADFIAKTIEVSVPIPVYSSSGAVPSEEGVAKLREEKVRVNLSIWDTAGQERFKSLGSAFYRGSDAVIVAFDLSAKGSLARTVNWYNDFCRLGDVGLEEQGMNSRQVKRAREQRERFCWVGVGCKGDLLPGPGSAIGGSEADDKWCGTGWTEARGWFDAMIPRYLPDGQTESSGYPFGTASQESTGAVPYSLGEEVPAKPEDVLSRPNKLSTSPPSADGRPAEAGVAPGIAPAPGSTAKRRQPASQERNLSQSKKGRDKRKSIRSIEVWQGDVGPSSADSMLSSSTATNSTSVPIHGIKDEYQRNRYDSTTSVGGAPSIYYSVRGSTYFSQSPAGASSSSPDGSTASSATTTRMVQRGGQHSRGLSLSSQARIRKQSNLSEVLTNDGYEETDRDAQEGAQITASTHTNGSSKTIKGEGSEAGQEGADEADLADLDVSIPTVPSGEPIPFPSGEDFEDDEEASLGGEEAQEAPRRRGNKRRAVLSVYANGEGEAGRKAQTIAEQVHDAEQIDTLNKPVNPRMTLYSARPSSITSTIKAADEAAAKSDDDDDIAIEKVDAGIVYRDQMIEQGFRLFFTSAKDDQGIDEVFEHIAKRVAMRWKLEEWEEEKERAKGGDHGSGNARTAPPTDEEIERERVRRAIKISSGKGTGSCCS